MRPALLVLALLAAAGVAEARAPSTPRWKMVWNDEFDSPSIDRAKWGFDVNCWGGGNDERQCYTDSARNASVADGKLTITARREPMTGPALPETMRKTAADKAATATKPFTSARLSTRGLASWRYGKVEVRARLPQGQGAWPAIWMLPEHNAYGPWAASGEIDILEAVNLGVACKDCPGGKEDRILGTLHFGGPWPHNLHKGDEVHRPDVLDDGFHRFGLVWQSGKMMWTFDGQVYATRTAKEWSTTATRRSGAPFDRPFHLILNLAIGGGLAEKRGLGGVANDLDRRDFQIDWVRVWQCDADKASGRVCQ